LFADSSPADTTTQAKSDAAKADTVVNPKPVIAINEVACGENPDWIELYNPGSSAVDLSGWTFSDTLADETVRAAFPADSIVPANGFLVVEISDEANGFKLAKDEAVAVYRPDGSTMDSVDWDDGACASDTSYARIPDGVGQFVTTSEPTADKPNQK
jgi:predicted extracellular nuclease